MEIVQLILSKRMTLMMVSVMSYQLDSIINFMDVLLQLKQTTFPPNDEEDVTVDFTVDNIILLLQVLSLYPSNDYGKLFEDFKNIVKTKTETIPEGKEDQYNMLILKIVELESNRSAHSQDLYQNGKNILRLEEVAS